MKIAALLFVLLILTSCSSSNDHLARIDEAYLRDYDLWLTKRVETLKKDWISLSGLDWVEDSISTIGSDSSNKIVLPAYLPAEVGSYEIKKDSSVNFHLTTDQVISVEDSTIVGGRDFNLAEDWNPVFRFDSCEWQLITRNGRYAIRSWDHKADQLKSFNRSSLDYFELDPKWIATATFEAYDPPRELNIQNIFGYSSGLLSPGKIKFQLEGRSFELDALENGGESLFIIFGDLTNGESTYGGGRYIYIPLPDEHGKTVIDFNRVYNPPCVFTPFATCPLPPAQNRMDILIEGGEKEFVQ